MKQNSRWIYRKQQHAEDGVGIGLIIGNKRRWHVLTIPGFKSQDQTLAAALGSKKRKLVTLTQRRASDVKLGLECWEFEPTFSEFHNRPRFVPDFIQVLVAGGYISESQLASNT